MVEADRTYAITAGQMPIQPLLLQSYPNPFNPATVIPFIIPAGTGASKAKISVFDVTGQLAWSEQTDGTFGQHSVVWDGTDRSNAPVASGVYIIRLDVGGLTASRMATLVC